MTTRRLALPALLLWILAVLPRPAAARQNIMEYYDPDNKDIPVLIFSSGEPKEFGTRFLSRPGVEYLPLSQMAARKEQLDKLPLVFLIAREHVMELPQELKEYLPMIADLKPTELFIYGDTPEDRCEYKAPGERRGRKYERTRLVIVAPTEEWLRRAIDMAKTLPDLPAREAKRKSPRFPNPLAAELPILCTVAGKGKPAISRFAQTAYRASQSQALGNPAALLREIALGHRPLIQFDADPGSWERHKPWLPHAEEAYLLLYEELDDLPVSVRSRLPREVFSLAPNQTLAVRKPRADAPPVSCLIAPTPYLLNSLIERLGSSTIPSTPEVVDVPDLRHVETITIAGTSNLTDVQTNLKAQLEERLMGVVSNARLFKGVRAGSDQLNTVLDTIRVEMAGVTKKDLDDVRVIANTDALLLAAITRAGGKTVYQSQRQQLTPNEPAFSESEPKKPDPNDRTRPFGPHKYTLDYGGKRENDPRYKDDLAKWEKEHAEWEKRKRDYERKLAAKRFEWKWQVTQRQEATVEITIGVFDLKAGAVVWASQPLVGQAELSGIAKERVIVVTGQGNAPSDPEETPLTRDTASGELFSQALRKAVDAAPAVLRDHLLLPGDLPSAVISAGGAAEDSLGERAASQPGEQEIPIEGAIGVLLDASPERVVVRIDRPDPAIKVGSILLAIADLEIRRDLDGTFLDVIERATVPIRVTAVYQRTCDGVPVNPAQAGRLKVRQPIRLPREGEALPE